MKTYKPSSGMARNIHDAEFGNLNVIFAGDVAQLPPVTGYALHNFSRTQS
jgi:hypothetical protein